MAAYYYGEQHGGLVVGYVIDLPEHKDSTYCLTSALYDKRDIVFGPPGLPIDFNPEYVYVSEQIKAFGGRVQGPRH